MSKPFPKEDMLAIFRLAEIKILNSWKLVNYYWENSQHTEVARLSPHWLVKTEYGLIQIGWRKRVIEINWSDTGIECIATEDDVTKDEHLVHAYSDLDAIKYLKTLNEAFKEHKNEKDI